MTKVKTKVRRIIFSVNEFEDKMLKELMEKEGKTDVSAFLGFLISYAYQLKMRNPIGRPKKEEDNSLPSSLQQVKDELGL